MSITSEQTRNTQALQNNGTTVVDSPGSVAKIVSNNSHSSPASAYVAPLTPSQSQMQSVATGDGAQTTTYFCRELTLVQQPGTPGSALPERALEQPNGPDLASITPNANGSTISIDHLDSVVQVRASIDAVGTLPRSGSSALAPIDKPSIQPPTAVPIPLSATCEPAASINAASATQPSPLAATGSGVTSTPSNHSQSHARSPRSANASSRAPPAVNGAAPNWPLPRPGNERPIWVFTSQLANDAVNVVFSGGCSSLVEYHFQKVGCRFLPPPGAANRPSEPQMQRFVPQPGPGRPGGNGPPPTGLNDKAQRTQQWVTEQDDDELLRQREAKMAKLDQLKRTLKLEETGSAQSQSTPRVAVKIEQAAASTQPNVAASPSAVPPLPDNMASLGAECPPAEVKTEVDVKCDTVPCGRTQPDVSAPQFARPQSAPSAGPSPSPAAQSIQSPGSLNETSLTSAPITTGGGGSAKRRQSVATSSSEKGAESQSKSKRRRSTQRANAPEQAVAPGADCAPMPPPSSVFETQARSPGACYAPGRGLPPMMPVPPGTELPGNQNTPRRGGSLGSALPDTASSLTSTSLSRLAEMTYSMSTMPPNGANGMQPPTLTRSASCHDEPMRPFASPPVPGSAMAPPNGAMLTQYESMMRSGVIRPTPDGSMGPGYPMMVNRNAPAPGAPPQPPGAMMNPAQQTPVNNTIINAHMSIQQMNIHNVSAPPGVNPLMQIQQVSHELASAAAVSVQNNLPQSVNLAPPSNIRVSFGAPPTSQAPPPSNAARFASYDSANGGNANVQIQSKAPNTIQYRPAELPARADMQPSGPRMPPFPGPPPPTNMHDFNKMNPNVGKMLPQAGNMFNDDARFAPNAPGPMMNGAYAQMNPALQQQQQQQQQQPPANNYDMFGAVNAPPGYVEYGYRTGPPQQQFGAPPPQAQHPGDAQFNAQYAPNASQAVRTSGMPQPDGSMMGMAQQSVNVNMNMSMNMMLHGPPGSQAQAQAQANEAQQINMQMQMNAAAQAHQQPSFTTLQGGPAPPPPGSYYSVGPSQSASAGNTFDDAELDLLVQQCANSGLLPFSNNGAPSGAPQSGGFFGSHGAPTGSGLSDDVDLFVQYASVAPSAQAQAQAPTGAPVNMSVNMNMNVQQGVLRPPAHDLYGARFASYQNAGGAMQPPVMQNVPARFRSPGPLEMSMAAGGPPLMGMPMHGEQQPVYDPAGHRFC